MKKKVLYTLETAVEDETVNVEQAYAIRQMVIDNLKERSAVWSANIESIITDLPLSAFVFAKHGYVIDVGMVIEAATIARESIRRNPLIEEKQTTVDQVQPVSRLTTDRNDPRLTHGVDDEPVAQAAAYLVLSEEEFEKGFVRPVRDSYQHFKGCGQVTTMGLKIAQTYARNPKFYGSTYCTRCMKHLPISEFSWTADGSVVGS